MAFRVVVPARYAASRLPGKPLRDVAGRPLVLRCVDAALRSGATDVCVATDDERIFQAVTADGHVAVMTRTDHASGTDRLAEVAALGGWGRDEVVVNLQGDEPLVPPALLARLADALATRPTAGIATAATEIVDPDELNSPHVVKVVVDDARRALYFSRALIPHDRDGARCAPRFRHLGLYAYRVGTLEKLASTPVHPLERMEQLEQLRALALGIPIHVELLDHAPAAGVDTPEDLARVEAIIRAGSC